MLLKVSTGNLLMVKEFGIKNKFYEFSQAEKLNSQLNQEDNS